MIIVKKLDEKAIEHYYSKETTIIISSSGMSQNIVEFSVFQNIELISFSGMRKIN